MMRPATACSSLLPYIFTLDSPLGSARLPRDALVRDAKPTTEHLEQL